MCNMQMSKLFYVYLQNSVPSCQTCLAFSYQGILLVVLEVLLVVFVLPVLLVLLVLLVPLVPLALVARLQFLLLLLCGQGSSPHSALTNHSLCGGPVLTVSFVARMAFSYQGILLVVPEVLLVVFVLAVLLVLLVLLVPLVPLALVARLEFLLLLLCGWGSSPHSALANHSLCGGPVLTVLFVARTSQPTLWLFCGFMASIHS
jgi:hypothetical protein